MRKFAEKHPEIIGLIILFAALIFFGQIRNKKFEKRGIITVCKILRLESAGGGSDMYIEVYFKGNKYETIISDLCFSCVGEYRYCMVLPDNRKDVILFDEVVPECILNTLPKYDSGWSAIPKCE